MKYLLCLMLWMTIILPNSGVGVTTEGVLQVKTFIAYDQWGIISTTKPHYEIRILYNTGYVQVVRYQQGERWACEEDYSYLEERLK